MQRQATLSDHQEEVGAFVASARTFCEFVETASTIECVAMRLLRGRNTLASLVAAATSLPLVEPTSDEPLVWDEKPAEWPGFGSHELYWMVFDAYVDDASVAGLLSDDFLDIYLDLKRGLVAFDDGRELDAVWEWRFHFDCHWGRHAFSALRALHDACSASATAASDSRGERESRKLIRTGGLVEETKISLGIHGPDVDPSAIAKLLGVEPTSQHRAGEARRSGPPWRDGAWLFCVEAKAPRGPEEAARELLAALPPADAACWTQLRSEHRFLLKVAVFFGGWKRGFGLSEETLQQLACIAGSVDFDLYADSGSES